MKKGHGWHSSEPMFTALSAEILSSSLYGVLVTYSKHHEGW